MRLLLSQAETLMSLSNRSPMTCLTVAGSDSSGGAGIQADLKTFGALGVYGACVITAVTAQNTQTVGKVHSVPPSVLDAQLRAVFSDVSVYAIKIGLLTSCHAVQVLVGHLRRFTGPVVLDPVLSASSGRTFMRRNVVGALCRDVLPHVFLLTPNLLEAATLLQCSVAQTESQILEQGIALLALGVQAVLIKGGHAAGAVCIDWLFQPGKTPLSFAAPRLASRNVHGTGCTLASAITANLAKGMALVDAVTQAHRYVQTALQAAQCWEIGRGQGPLHHFYEFWM